MPITKICTHPGCNNRTPQGTPRCPTHAKADNERRARKAQAHGRTTQHWRNLSRQARQLHPYCACGCGQTADLTVHLNPAADCYPRHDLATLDDIQVMNRRCHGSHDAPRAKGGGVRNDGNERHPRA